MKFETTPAFDSDYRRLKREHAAAFTTVDGELRCRWRRVGDHDVFNKP